MPTEIDAASPLEALAAEVAADVERIERELRAEVTAMLAEIRAAHAETQIKILSHLSLLKDGPPGAPGERGEPGEAIIGPPGEQGIQGPPGRDGSDGRDGADGKDGLDGVPGADGRDGADGAPGQAGSDGKDGIDGSDGAGISDAFVGRDGELVLTFTDGRTKNLGAGFAADINAEAIAGMVSKAVEELWQGVWEPGPYRKGAWITYGGSIFIAAADTAPGDRPTASEVWRLALKRGRDGKDAAPPKAPRPALPLPAVPE